MRAAHVLLSCLLTALVGCGASSSRTERTDQAGRTDSTDRPAGEKNRAKPAGTSQDRFTRANFHRVQPPMPFAEVERIFGPPDTREDHGSEVNYTWGPKGNQLQVGTNSKGIVQGVSWPGQEEHDRRLFSARQRLHGLALLLTEHMLARGTSRFPASYAEIKSPREAQPELGKLIAAGEIVVPWGESANQLLWAWWKDTPETGGPAIRYDLKLIANITPEEFAKQKGVKLTSRTIPAEHTMSAPWEKPEKAFFFMHDFMHTLEACIKNPALPGPKNLREYPIFMTRGDQGFALLRLMESGQLVVRWDRHPARGLYAYYPKNFPLDGGWAVVDGVPKDYTSLKARELIANETSP